MGYHAINEGGTITVWGTSICADGPEVDQAIVGKLYNGECFVFLGQTTGYFGNYEIRFRDSTGTVRRGYINTGTYGNLFYSGTKVYSDEIGTSYRFELRRPMSLLNNDGTAAQYLHAGDYIYTNTGTAGESRPENMGIKAYKKDGDITYFDGFAKLEYKDGSMFGSNFHIMKG